MRLVKEKALYEANCSIHPVLPFTSCSIDRSYEMTRICASNRTLLLLVALDVDVSDVSSDISDSFERFDNVIVRCFPGTAALDTSCFPLVIKQGTSGSFDCD